MDKLEHFDKSHRAIERSEWKYRQTEAIADNSRNAISNSIKLMDLARNLGTPNGTDSE